MTVWRIRGKLIRLFCVVLYYNCWATVCKTVHPMLSVRCLSCLSVMFMHCVQMVGRIKMKLGMQVGLDPGHIVLDEDSALPPPKWHSPQFSAIFILFKSSGPGDFVLDGDPAPLPKRGRSPLPNFWPIFVVARWLDASRCHLVWR